MAATLGDISCHVTGQPGCPLADLQAVQLGWALLVYLEAETLISLLKVKKQQGPDALPCIYSVLH